MLAFRNTGAIRVVQGRRLLTSLVRHDGHRYRQPKPKAVWPEIAAGDPFGRPRPRPIVMETIELIKKLSLREKSKFRFIFSELLDLPKPPEESPEGEFAVKLVKFDPEKRSHVLREVAWVKSTVKVIKKLNELGLRPSMEVLKNVPSVIKQGVSKEEANEIIAKIEAAGGVAVMEPLESD